MLSQKIKLSNTIVNGRYCFLYQCYYWFIVLEIDYDRIKIQYYDKSIVIIHKNYTIDVDVFNFPFSSLEKQLL